jgi:hypothetical protein
MIGQPSGVLEYDAVLAVNDKFRQAVSLNDRAAPALDVALTTQSRAHTRARHTQTCPQSS